MPEITTPEQEWVQEPDLIKATYSSLTLHRKCPQAWYYRYGLGLRQPVTGPAPQLRYGSWWGALMGADALERGRRFDSLVVPPRRWTPVDGGPTFDQKTVTTTEIILAARDWWNAQDDITKEVSLEKMGAPVANRIRDAFVRYRDEYGKQLEYERPLGLEVFWERPLPRPAEDGAWENSADLLQLEGLPEIRLFGYVDQVMFDTSRGMITVKDDKFLSSLGNMTAVDDMMDSQLDLYAWGVERTLQRYDINERVRAVMFDRVKSTAPSTPKLNLNGSLSASVTQFDLKTYLDWAREDTRPGPFPTYGPDGWTPGPVFGVEQEVWDKLTEDTPMFVIESDATIVAPLLLRALLECRAKREIGICGVGMPRVLPDRPWAIGIHRRVRPAHIGPRSGHAVEMRDGVEIAARVEFPQRHRARASIVRRDETSTLISSRRTAVSFGVRRSTSR